MRTTAPRIMHCVLMGEAIRQNSHVRTQVRRGVGSGVHARRQSKVMKRSMMMKKEIEKQILGFTHFIACD